METAALIVVLSAAPVCEGRGTALVVRDHQLTLCEGGVVKKRYAVSLGSGGTGKSRQGDEKTPLGSYPLGAPRASAKFKTFIPLEYPTSAQRKQGFTGGSIGVHGPDRKFTWAGQLNAKVDWTLGCIAVGSDEEIDEIAGWVREKKPALIHIE